MQGIFVYLFCEHIIYLQQPRWFFVILAIAISLIGRLILSLTENHGIGALLYLYHG
jgi:hypothetical protein